MIEILRLLRLKKSNPERYRLLRILEAAATGKVPKDIEQGKVSLVFIGRPEIVGTDPYIDYIRRATEEDGFSTFYLYARGLEDLRRAKTISETLCSQNDYVETDRLFTQPRRTDQEFVPQGIFCVRRTAFLGMLK